MTPLRTAVIGIGVQGQRHAEKLAALPASQLVAVVDTDVERANTVAANLGTEAVTDYRDLIGHIDAVALSTPTSTHFEIASTLLENGIHLLLEKPITTTLDEAQDLLRLAEYSGIVLQVGHLERFNPAVVALTRHVRQPQFIESTRIAPYKPRALDVSVVLDLMIHDIDLIHSFVRSPMEHVDAVGRSVFSDSIDVANARIRFADGCVANVTSSRVSLKTERSLRIFQADSYASVDLQNRSFTYYGKRGTGPVSGPEDVAIDKQTFDAGDAMMDQTQAFLDSICGGPPPLVDGQRAMEALETALAIANAVARQPSL
ncbi:MAG: Gfo/Idh/MocA family oxidoreductase [Gammaproteobacteria bacterium]|nr:Gfo/Idh/MocA family oxidoreductase [Gammaproteobacteria bacterium]MDH3372424.1 Gfo/Idh/MocA family oxidoreductase [Gammaproteobacteria bacterium]MDH3409135.1 Gfo/Idh/MocA family oxidoreductase [Gammaproteobacteria bacterium]MDH3551166.1 Gfo/Idh/MocA family oxidoreductase [Gammaproteobacteria bacterium]